MKRLELVLLVGAVAIAGWLEQQTAKAETQPVYKVYLPIIEKNNERIRYTTMPIPIETSMPTP